MAERPPGGYRMVESLPTNAMDLPLFRAHEIRREAFHYSTTTRRLPCYLSLFPFPSLSLSLSNPSHKGPWSLGGLDRPLPAFSPPSLPSSLFFSFLLSYSMLARIPNRVPEPHQLDISIVRHIPNHLVRAGLTSQAIACYMSYRHRIPVYN